MNSKLRAWLYDHWFTLITAIFMAGVLWANLKAKSAEFDKIAAKVEISSIKIIDHETHIQLIEKDIDYIKRGIETLVKRK